MFTEEDDTTIILNKKNATFYSILQVLKSSRKNESFQKLQLAQLACLSVFGHFVGLALKGLSSTGFEYLDFLEKSRHLQLKWCNRSSIVRYFQTNFLSHFPFFLLTGCIFILALQKFFIFYDVLHPFWD